MPKGGKKWRQNPVRRRSPSPQWHETKDDKERYDKFTARFFKQATEQRDDYKRQVERLALLISQLDDIDHAAFNSRKEHMWSRLRTFDRALALFNDKRNFDDSSDRFEEHFGSVNKVPPKQRRNLTLAKFAQFHQRNKMIESKPPINIPRFDVSLAVMPYVDGYSSTQQLRLEIHSGRKNELLSGFLAIHHPNKNDTIHYIYLSDQKVLLFTDQLIERGYVSSTNSSWADLRMTLCINKYARSDGELAQLFLDDLRNHNRDIKAEIRQIETRQLNERVGQRTFDDGEIERELERHLAQEQMAKEHLNSNPLLQSPGACSLSSGASSSDKYKEQFSRVVDGETITNINAQMAYGNICIANGRLQRDPRHHQHQSSPLNLEQCQWPHDQNWADPWPPTRKRRVTQTSTEPVAKTVKKEWPEPVSEHYFKQQDIKELATLKAKLAKETAKLNRDKKTFENWQREWRQSVGDYSDEAMIAENVEQEYQMNYERGLKRINDRKDSIALLVRKVQRIEEELELYK